VVQVLNGVRGRTPIYRQIPDPQGKTEQRVSQHAHGYGDLDPARKIGGRRDPAEHTGRPT
jgi:hypothetical protein